jgi:hypothetical protein
MPSSWNEINRSNVAFCGDEIEIEEEERGREADN